MFAPLVAIALTTSAVGVPDAALVAKLGAPHYPTREWAQGRLYGRIVGRTTPAAFETTALAVRAGVRSPNPEVAARCGRLHGAVTVRRADEGIAVLDRLTKGAYPCYDTLAFDEATRTYRAIHTLEPGHYLLYLPDAPSPYATAASLPGAFVRLHPPGEFGAYRWKTRYLARKALGAGATLDEVLGELGRLNQIDAGWYVRNRIRWDQPDPVPYVVELFRWDNGWYGRGLDVAPDPAEIP